MKIGHVTGALSSNGGGVLEAVGGLARAMQALPECEVRLLGLQDKSGAPPLRMPDVACELLPIRGPGSFGYAPSLPERLADLDIVHVHGLWLYASIAATRWGQRNGGPRLISPHGMLDGWALRRGSAKKRLALFCYERAHLEGANCLHALSLGELEAIRTFGLENPVCVIPNGVRLPEARNLPAPAWRATLPEHAKALLYLGRLHAKKGLLDLLQAFALTEAEQKKGQVEWYLVIAGWDQEGHRAELENCAGAFGITHRVRFVGPQFGDDKAATFAASDAFVLPSLSEGLPMAVLEAWAAGLPALITPHCNLPEGEDAGAAISMAASVEGVTGGLRRLYTLSDRDRLAMGQRGLELVRDRFTWESVARRMASVYRWLLDGGAPPACVRMT